MPDTTLLKVSYGTKAKYDAVASKVNGTLYVITDQHRMFVKLPDLDPFELNASEAAVANSVAQTLLFSNAAGGGDAAGAYNGSTGSTTKTVGCVTIGALHSSKAISGVAFSNEKIVISLADNTTTFETAVIKPANATHADTAGSVGGSLTFGNKSYNGASGQTLTLADLLTDGKVPLSYIPASAQERIYALPSNRTLASITEAQAQPGDIVKTTDSTTGITSMYIVTSYDSHASLSNNDETLSFEPFAAGHSVSADTAYALSNGLTFHFVGNISFQYAGTASNNQVYIGNRLTASVSNESVQNGTVTGSDGVYLNLSSMAGNADTWGVKSTLRLVGSGPVRVTSDAGVISFAVNAMSGATQNSAGTAGLVPAPAATGGTTSYLDAYGNWSVPANNNIYHTSGSWGGTNNLTYTAVTNSTGIATGSGETLAFTLPRASEVNLSWVDLGTRSTSYGVVKGATDGSIQISDSGVISVPSMQGSAANAAGRKGLVPAPEAGIGSTAFLRADGTWATPSYTQNTHYEAYLIVTDATTDTQNKSGTVANGSVILNVVEALEGSNVRNTRTGNAHKIVGSDGIAVTALVSETRTDINIAHTNVLSTGVNTLWGPNANTTVTLNAGTTMVVPAFKYDANGHITEATQVTFQVGAVTAVADFGSANGGQKIATILGTDIYTGIAWGEL